MIRFPVYETSGDSEEVAQDDVGLASTVLTAAGSLHVFMHETNLM